MLEKAHTKSVTVAIDDLRQHGKQAKLFPGLTDRSWFK